LEFYHPKKKKKKIRLIGTGRKKKKKKNQPTAGKTQPWVSVAGREVSGRRRDLPPRPSPSVENLLPSSFLFFSLHRDSIL
jgi:hypothetical protein